jgi:hypothetical protein
VNAQVLHGATKQFTGLTNPSGVTTVSWAMFDFTAAPFPSTASYSVLRCTIDVDAVAIDTTKQYTRGYSAKIIYTWTVSGTAGAILTASLFYADGTLAGGDEMYWTFTVGTAGAPTLSAVANHSAKTYNVSMAAEIVAYADI